mgnify:CR=1 FL=1
MSIKSTTRRPLRLRKRICRAASRAASRLVVKMVSSRSRPRVKRPVLTSMAGGELAPQSSRWHLLVTAMLVVVVCSAFSPALDVFISGDDFEWLESSYDVLQDPLSSFRLENNFFRPLVKWSYLIDYLVFGQNAVGYMITNLVIHLLNALLLFWLLVTFFATFTNVFLPLAVAAILALILKPYQELLCRRLHVGGGVAVGSGVCVGETGVGDAAAQADRTRMRGRHKA